MHILADQVLDVIRTAPLPPSPDDVDAALKLRNGEARSDEVDDALAELLAADQAVLVDGRWHALDLELR